MSETRVTGTPGLPILLYAPGLGRSPANTADNIADILARSIDNQQPDGTYGTRTPQGVAAPHGLTISKTVVDAVGRPILQVFELDYRNLLNRTASQATPSVTAGAFRSAWLAAWAIASSIRALRTGAKDRRTKAQLALGLAAAGALIFAALVSLYALLCALGSVPSALWVGKIFDLNVDAGWTFGVATVGTTLTWAALRRKILALAASADRTISFVRDEDRIAGDIARQVDRAADQLSANGWTGPVHLLGYSFGSLVFFEAVFPKRSGNVSGEPLSRVESLITVGCPIDLVRLYAPAFLQDRGKRRPVVWTNVFNAADIFASNLMDGPDDRAGKGFDIDGVQPFSYRYTDESVGPFGIFTAGRTHSRYWSDADGAHCLDPVAARFMADSKAPPTHEAR